MKSLRIIVRRHGGPEVLETIEEEAPEPGQGEARVRVLVAGVSFAEMLMREGLHPEKTILPFAPGWDIVRRRSGGQRLPKTIHPRRGASSPAGNRNHLCRFGVHLADFG